MVQRRHGDVGVAVLDERTHVTEQEGQQQGGDVLAVDVGIGHDDDLAVAQLGDVEVLTDAGTEGGDEAADRIGRQDPVQAQ